MLTDSSLTNIFLVSGVSHIRYRVYSQQCERSQLARLLKSEAVPESISLSNHHWPKDHHQPESILIQAFRNLVQLNIPCVWRPAPTTTQLEEEKASNKVDDHVVLLELWVFWFDDRHTGLVDNNEMLKQLEEIKMGSFTWENTIAKNISPTASPITGNQSSSSSSASVATVINRVSNEYILFVKAVKRLIRCSILQKGGVLPLGEFFIFSHKSDMTNDILPYTTEPAINDSMLSCTYNVYLSNTNLVVQPDVRRLEIRPLSLSDLDKKEGTTTVITSPLGERAAILPMQQDIPEQLEEKILREWSLLFDIPLRCLNSCRQQRPCAAPKLPALTPIRSLRGDVVLYPTALLFISTASSTLSSASSDMNGVLRYHQGYTEDLVQQWNHWWWSDQVTNIATRNKTQHHHHHHHASPSILNYWDYGSPKLHTASAMFDTLSMTAENISANGVLKRALDEVVGSSPIMASKTVATPASLGCKNETMSPLSTKEGDESRRVEEESELSVADFARIHFADPIEKQQQPMLTSPDVKPEPVTTTTTTTMPVQEVPITASATVPPTMNISNNNTMGYMDSTALLLSGGTTTDQMAAAAGTGNTTTTTDDAFDFRFGMDALGGSAYDMSNRWGDAMEDLDNLDLHVTEEDFDFFESEPTSNKAPASQQQQQQQQHADFNNDLLKVTTQDFQQQLQQQQPSGTTVNENDRLMLMEGMPLSGIGEVPEADGEIDLDALLGGTNGVLDDQLLGNTSQVQPQATTVTTATSGGTQPSPMMTNGNLTAIETSADDSAVSFREKSISLKGMTTSPMLMEPHTLENHFVPPDFAPVQFSEGVDNAKYLEGGKFMYAPKKDASARDPITTKRKRRLRRSLYRPDYVPRLRKRIKNKDDNNNSIVHTYPNYTPPSIRPLLMYRPKDSTSAAVNKYHKRPQQTTLDLAEEEGSSCSSSSSSSSDDDDDSSSCSEEGDEDEIKSYSGHEKEKSDSHDPQWWMSGLQSVHDSVVDQLLVASPSMRRTGSDAEAKSDTRTIQSQEDFKVLDYLCQQVVMGGYPFDNGLSAVSSNLGQVHIGESTTALVAQRRKLLQRAHGAFNHVPSLSNDFHRVSQDFKDVLMNIFDRTRTSTVTTPDANSSNTTNADGMLPMTVGTVGVKGPLSVQQYYDLSETSQAQSKYGKYQVRKRRPAEPNLDTLTPPDILAGRHEEEYIEGSPQMITMWEKLRLEPYSSRKNVLYFVVYPANEQLESTCSHFFKALSTVYESCHLGIHHSGTISTYRRGLVPVPLLPPSSANETWEERQLRSYNAECQNLGSALGNAMVERMHIVIYIVNPSNTMSSHFDLSRCYHKLMVAYHAASMGISTHSLQERRARLVMQLVPIEHIIRSSSAFGGYTKFGLKDIAFSVYSKCLPVMSRKHPKPDVEDAGPIASTMYAPPFILAKSSPDTIQFSLKGSANLFPTILESNATLHMAYSFTLDRRWIILVWTDNQGELLEYAVRYIDNDKSMAQVIEDAWKQTLQVSARTGFEWTFVIAKVGLMFLEELQMWADCIPNDAKVAITCVDMESALRVNADQLHRSSVNIASVMDYPQTPGSSSANTPTPEAFNTTSIPSSVGGIKNNVSDTGSAVAQAQAAANSDITGATKTLLLNHRVAYSEQRAQVSEAFVGGLNDEADGNWMLPLATGYLIHIYAKPENPCREQINNEPLIMDVHLLLNQTGHSAYSTLRNIIKRYHALAYVYTTPSAGGSLPIHVVLVSRLEHVLSIISKT